MIAVLLSGGIDSAVCLLRAIDTDEPVCSVAIDYNQYHQVELQKALALAAAYRVPHKLIKAHCYARSEVLDNDAMVFAHRNAMLITLAAFAMQPDEIWIGCNADDQEDYADCRPLFLAQMGKTLGIKTVAPLVTLTKADVIREAIERDLDLDMTMSCYRGTDCGTCNACKLRSQAIKEATI